MINWHDEGDSEGPASAKAVLWPWMAGSLLASLCVLVVKLWPLTFGPAGDRMLGLSYGSGWVVGFEVLLFVPLGFLETQLARRLLGGFSGLVVIVVALDALVLGLIGEVAQHWIPARESSVVHLAANVLGAVVGYLAALYGKR